VKEDAASTLRCRDWRLTAQNRKVWGQKLREALQPDIGLQRHRMDGWMKLAVIQYPMDYTKYVRSENKSRPCSMYRKCI
jgi:hypothetical protein